MIPGTDCNTTRNILDTAFNFTADIGSHDLLNRRWELSQRATGAGSITTFWPISLLAKKCEEDQQPTKISFWWQEKKESKLQEC